jgi:hypothetical protein
MTDIADEAPPDGEPAPTPQPQKSEKPEKPEKESTPDPAPQPDATKQPASPSGADKADDADTGEESDAILTAAGLAESIGVRRQIRQAGLRSLGGTWFGGPARFSAPASFGGHAAARDVNIYYAATERAVTQTGLVDAGLLRHIRQVHAASGSHARAEGVLRGERLVVLRGADGSGRRTTALFLLHQLVGQGVHVIAADVVLSPPEGTGLPENAGYLAESRTQPDIAYAHLAAWARELDRQQAYLVLTVPAGTAANTEVVDRFIADHKVPDCHEVVRRHLRHDPAHASEAERLLKTSVALACATTPGAAADLAANVLLMVRDGRATDDLGPVVAEIRRERARHLLRIDRPNQPRERIELLCRRAALVSLAVFTGLPYSDAVAAAEALAAGFIAIEFPKHLEAGRELFIPWRELLKAEPDIVIEEAELSGHWGTAVTQQLRFRDPELHVTMLEEMWEHYDATRSPLLEWLRELATGPRDEAVRVRGAQIVGRLAIRDFGHVCHRLLLDWADSVNARAREAAATALEAAAVTMAPQVWELLADWCENGNQHRQQTAVLALGTTIGEERPGQTLDRLRQLALRGSGRSAQLMGEFVRRSITELLSGPHQEAVMHELRTWSEGKDPRLAALARRCVPPLAYVTDDSGQPLLLVALVRTPALREDIAVLFTAVLRESDTRQEGWDALEKLTVAAAPDPSLTDALGRLLADLNRMSSIAAAQLFFYLGLWVHHHPGIAA